VNINNKPAFVYYVSPSQVNVLAPDDTASGSVQVTVTNSGGTSSGAPAVLQNVAPAFFSSNGNIAAVRPDGTIVNGSSTFAKSGDVLELFGTGFGSTSPAKAAGAVFQGAVALANPVSLTIGGVPANVSFAGLSGAGLNQVNITVPALADRDYPVVAQVGTVSTQSGVILKVRN